MAALGRQVRDLSDHFLALSWRLDLQEQTLTQRLCEVRLPCYLGEGSRGGGAGPGSPPAPKGTSLTSRSQTDPVTACCQAQGGPVPGRPAQSGAAQGQLLRPSEAPET